MTKQVNDPDDRRILEESMRLNLVSNEESTLLVVQAAAAGMTPDQYLKEQKIVAAEVVDAIEATLAPTSFLAGYQIIELIGRGGMGIVYRARQAALNRIVALKTIRPALQTDQQTIERFSQEAQLIAKLTHPNIVNAFDFGQDKSYLYLALEFVEGEDLASLVRQEGAFDEIKAWEIARQIASGLSHAANVGVVHRDVKPANVMMVRPPEGSQLPEGVLMAKLSDFGLALLSATNDGTGSMQIRRGAIEDSNETVFGSPAYMAPELFCMEEADSSTDVYALGVTVHHMLTGRPPTAGLSISETIKAKLNDDLPQIQDVAPDVHPRTIQLINHMTQRDRAERFTSYGDLIRSIDDTLKELRGETSAEFRQTHRAANPDRSRPNTSTKRRWLAICVVAALAGLLIIPLTSQTSTRSYVRVGNTEFLFNGETLDPSQWRVGASSQGWSVKEGEILHDANAKFPYLVGHGPEWPYFLLSVELRLETDARAQIHFQIAEHTPDSEHLAIELTMDQAVVGRAKRGNKVDAASQPFELDAQRTNHLVEIERHPRQWWIKIDGREIGTLRADDSVDNNEFAFSVLEGQVGFSVVTARELRDPRQAVQSTETALR